MPKRQRLKRGSSSASKRRMKVVDFHHMEYPDLFKFVSEVFTKRFGRRPDDDKGYFQEWMGRYRDGRPEAYMDSDTLRVHRELLKKKGWMTAHSQ